MNPFEHDCIQEIVLPPVQDVNCDNITVDRLRFHSATIFPRHTGRTISVNIPVVPVYAHFI